MPFALTDAIRRLAFAIIATATMWWACPLAAQTGGVAPFPTSGRPSTIARPLVAAPAVVAKAADDWWHAPPALFTSLVSGVFGLGGTWLGLWFGLRNTRATNNQKANEAEQAAIAGTLATFHGPYLQRSRENLLLASEFHARRGPGFRTLLALLDPSWLPSLAPADQTIVREIVGNGRDLRAMLRDKAGAVDPVLRPYLARAGTHFTMLALAADGALEDDRERFERFVYPRPLDDVLDADMRRLLGRIELLRGRPFDRHGPIQPLSISADQALAPWVEAPGIVSRAQGDRRAARGHLREIGAGVGASSHAPAPAGTAAGDGRSTRPDHPARARQPRPSRLRILSYLGSAPDPLWARPNLAMPSPAWKHSSPREIGISFA